MTRFDKSCTLLLYGHTLNGEEQPTSAEVHELMGPHIVTKDPQKLELVLWRELEGI